MSIVAVIPARGGSTGISGKKLRTVVSTDELAIADAAHTPGAEVVDRPAHLSGDRATSESDVLHAPEHSDPAADTVVLLQPTSPFIDSAALCEAVDHDPSARPRHQYREPNFPKTGVFYVMRAARLRRARFRFFGRVGIAIVDERTGIEIDTLDQLSLANAIAPLVVPSPSHHPCASP